MIEPMIVCPKCKTEIRLTESLAAPLIEATRQQYEQKLAKQNEEIAERETTLRQGEKSLGDAKRDFEQSVATQVAEQLKVERLRVAEEEANKAKAASAAEIEQMGARKRLVRVASSPEPKAR